VTWVALFPQVVLLAYLIPLQVPFLLSAVLSTVIPVSALTWVVMPRLTVWLRRWLYPALTEHKE
jgi:antibiotic biosynthesis monooxygenase (ABM) superfamily enzyme